MRRCLVAIILNALRTVWIEEVGSDCLCCLLDAACLIWSCTLYSLPQRRLFVIQDRLTHFIYRQDTNLEELQSVKIEAESSSKEIYRAEQFYHFGYNNLTIKFFDCWRIFTLLFLLLGFVPIPYAYLPVQAIHFINAFLFTFLITFQALRLRFFHNDTIKLQSLLKDLVCFSLWTFSHMCCIGIFIYFALKRVEKHVSLERVDFIYYAMFVPQIIAYYIADHFFPNFGGARPTLMKFISKDEVEQEVYLTFQACVDAKKSVEQAVQHMNKH